MSDRLKELREKRGKVITDMRAAIEAAEKEKRDLTTEELKAQDDMFKAADGYRQQIDAIERALEVERQNASRQEEEDRTRSRGEQLSPEKLQMRAFGKWLLGGARSLNDDELRALQVGSFTEGGVLQPPQEFIAQLLKGVDDAVFIRQRATKFQLPKAESLGIPTLDTDLDDFDWTTELQTGNEDTAMRFGKREFRPHPMAKRVKISKTLMRKSALPVENIVGQRGSYKLGVTQEKSYLTGNGNQRPLGVFVASADGIPTTRDKSTGNTSTEITFDGLIENKYNVKAQYWPKSDWLFHRDAVKQIVKIKDGDGQYIWRMSVRDGEPDVLLGRPMMISEFAPNTFTTGQYVGMFGDFSFYWIIDALDVTVQRLTELYAESNQEGFIFRYEGDGAPALAEAFSRIKLG